MWQYKLLPDSAESSPRNATTFFYGYDLKNQIYPSVTKQYTNKRIFLYIYKEVRVVGIWLYHPVC